MMVNGPWNYPALPDGVTGYAVGFAISGDTDTPNVLLIEKARPEWQAGKLNGIGGHIEPGETPHQAMRREFKEETGLLIHSWGHFLTMEFPGAVIWFFRTRVSQDTLDKAESLTDEKVICMNIDAVTRNNIIPNLAWLVPLAAYNADTYKPIHVVASSSTA